MVVTGSAAHIERHLMDAVLQSYQVFAIADCSQVACGAPIDPKITWLELDIADREAVLAVFRHVRDSGGADLVIHLAAYYDFVSEDHPLYWSTNVDGLRHVLDASRELKPKRFFFASSAAACDFTEPGRRLTEARVGREVSFRLVEHWEQKTAPSGFGVPQSGHSIRRAPSKLPPRPTLRSLRTSPSGSPDSCGR